jgi:hypothetical protein
MRMFQSTQRFLGAAKHHNAASSPNFSMFQSTQHFLSATTQVLSRDDAATRIRSKLCWLLASFQSTQHFLGAATPDLTLPDLVRLIVSIHAALHQHCDLMSQVRDVVTNALFQSTQHFISTATVLAYIVRA